MSVLPTEEEREAFRKARSQVQTHSRLGALAEHLLAVIFDMYGNNNFGSQIGFFTGTAAGLRTIKSLPNSQRIFEAIKDAHFRKIAQIKNKVKIKIKNKVKDVDSSALSDELRLMVEILVIPRMNNLHGQNIDQRQLLRDNSNHLLHNMMIIIQNPTFNNESSNESIPRTREDFEELRNEGKIRTNQYGDIEIIN
ncbi:unnamed protein product [Rhizophagus irregularis]|nr:unnamed protein product [Rhizophagus irregularis]